jgi:pyruvate/2-oxoglutarate dehydrogenase complex dihydrolipoamide acyltransferase (E2) component
LILKIAMVASVCVAVGCGVDRGSGAKADSSARVATTAADEPSPETFALGTAVTPTGAVAQSAASDTVLRGGEVYLSVDVRSASTEHVIEVRWVDPAGRVLRRDARQVHDDAQWVPFSSGGTSRWSPGPHRAVILIDGRTVSEKSFAVL